LRQKTAKAAKKFTRNFSVRQIGSTCVATLRMSGAKLAFVQVKEHFKNIEERFDAVYAGFLQRHKKTILESAGVYGSQNTGLAPLLSEMGRQAANAGIADAEAAVSQVIDRQAKSVLYLLHSVYGRVWTVELPPNLLNEMGKTLLPSFFVEDLSIADMYDEVEDFKKRTIYGFDSLANLAVENERALQEALLSPEQHQVISSFEPVKSRLIFVGRTEQIENIIDSFGGLFVCQAWCGYFDNLLSEVNLSLFALSRSPLPNVKSIRLMKDGELAVLEKDLSMLRVQERLITDLFRDLKCYCKCAGAELEHLGNRLKPTQDFNVGLFEDILKINAENLAHLPSQFEGFRALSQGLFREIKKTERLVKKELDERKTLAAKKKRRRLALAPFFIVLSVVLGFLGYLIFTGYVTVVFLAGALLLQLSFWAAHLQFLRSFNTVDRYPSLAFRQIHFFTLAFTESLYKLTTTANVLAPMEPASVER